MKFLFLLSTLYNISFQQAIINDINNLYTITE